MSQCSFLDKFQAWYFTILASTMPLLRLYNMLKFNFPSLPCLTQIKGRGNFENLFLPCRSQNSRHVKLNMIILPCPKSILTKSDQQKSNLKFNFGGHSTFYFMYFSVNACTILVYCSGAVT